MKSFVCLAVIALSVSAHAQTESVPPSNVPLRPVIKMDPVQPELPTFEINTAWNEKSKGNVAVPLENTSDSPMKILGVQCTSGMFVVDYPEKIRPKSQDTITVLFEQAEDSDTGDEILRVKTDQGIKTLKVKVTRTAGVVFEKKELHWAVGEEAAGKSILIKTGSTGVTPLSVKVSGGGHKAQLETVDSSTYRLTLWPASTAKPARFAARISFSQRLPGVAPIIMGSVGE